MSARTARTKSRSGQRWVIAVLAVLAFAAAALYWLQQQALSSATAAPAPSLSAPLPAIAPRVPPATADDLAPLAERIAAIEQQVAPLGSRLTAIEAALSAINASVQAMNARFDKAVSAVAAPKQAAAPKKLNARKTRTKRASAKRSAAVKASSAALPALVAADQWGRGPSATLRRADGTLSFHRVGDTIGRARITAIDPGAQAIQLRIDGKLSTLKVAR